MIIPIEVDSKDRYLSLKTIDAIGETIKDQLKINGWNHDPKDNNLQLFRVVIYPYQQ